jgi:hypothetical protein
MQIASVRQRLAASLSLKGDIKKRRFWEVGVWALLEQAVSQV